MADQEKTAGEEGPRLVYVGSQVLYRETGPTWEDDEPKTIRDLPAIVTALHDSDDPQVPRTVDLTVFSTSGTGSFVQFGSGRHLWRYVYCGGPFVDGQEAIDAAEREARALNNPPASTYMAVPTPAISTRSNS